MAVEIIEPISKNKMTPISFNLKKHEQPYVFVGLGNIGKEYALTRHNAGFFFIDALSDALEKEGYYLDKKEEAEYELLTCKSLQLALIKPKTMMNLSGKAVMKYYRYHGNYSSSHLVVIHDDLDLMLGDYKVNAGKGPRLHNGLRSIEQELCSNEFVRIRLGIENRQGKPITGLDYVLYRFQDKEIEVLENCIKGILQERFTY